MPQTETIDLEGIFKTAPVEPDWEQRRYEIARDMYVHFTDMTPKTAVNHADMLIEELKKVKECQK